MCQKQAVKFSHVIHIKREGGCEVEEAEEVVRETERGGWGGERHKGWSDAVGVIKPASTNTTQVQCAD